jgi:hypothetical protein
MPLFLLDRDEPLQGGAHEFLRHRGVKKAINHFGDAICDCDR